MIEEATWHDGDGFRLARPATGGRCIFNIAHWSPELDTLLRQAGDIHIVQQADWAEGASVLAQLARFIPQIRALTLGTQAAGDLAILNQFIHLEELSLGQPAEAINFRLLPSLRAISLNPGSTLGRVAETPCLQSLDLWSVPVRDLTELAPLGGLRRLVLRQIVACRSLEGIAALPLEHLVLTYVNRLTSVTPLRDMQRLRYLKIDGASKATGGDVIGQLAALEVLDLDNGPALPSLDGFESMPSFKSMRVFNTPIGRGPCSVLPLARAVSLRQLYLCGEKRSLENLLDLDRLGTLVNLRRLALDRVGEIATLEWIRTLVQLESFAWGGGRLLDGDVSPLFDLPKLIFLDVTARGIARSSPEYQELKRCVMARDQESRTASAGGPSSGDFEEFGAINW